MIDDKVELAISLILMAANVFPDRKFWLKNISKLDYLVKSVNFEKTVIFLFSTYYKHKNTFCVQI